ncbi:transglutaminase-like domain-containing protein [Zophobihabitans entericus]|uniref:Transglutaminase family protein n=1 Tax=Zophobihabitans entericus TaxID=1635327 RepID=A0A6G9IB00_9GAMM|nr:transglutaminase family protein [Zophobihabitans entericus]QIQ21393.1 transglutaminase family protein [Zophobihabitans entericus]
MKNYLKPTQFLDFNNPAIQQLINDRHWRSLNQKEQILQVYNFVRDEIKFGFNVNDTLSASVILQEGIGQCNTKTILFMAILRALGIPCRLHGFTIDKKLQSGIMNGDVYNAMPDEIVHTWAEVYFNDRWYKMEGLILDVPYLTGLQHKFASNSGAFCGFAVATPNLQDPPVYWNGDNDTYIQKEGIVQDFGLFDDPDSFFALHSQKMSPEQMKLFGDKLRYDINDNIAEIRKEGK